MQGSTLKVSPVARGKIQVVSERVCQPLIIYDMLICTTYESEKQAYSDFRSKSY